jgi:hypothetical protein
MIFTFHNNILSYYNYFIIHDPTPFSLEGLLSSALCHLSLDRRRIYPPLSAAFDLQTMIIMSWCRIQQSWDARGWFFGAQVFGEKFLTGDLPRYLKSEPIPHKVGHSALSAAPVFAVMSSVNDGLLVYNLFTCFAKNLVVIYVWHYSKIHGVCNWCVWHVASNLSSVLDWSPTFNYFSKIFLWLTFYKKCNALVTTQILPLCSHQGLKKLLADNQCMDVKVLHNLKMLVTLESTLL